MNGIGVCMGGKERGKKRRSEEKAIIVQTRAVATANTIILCINLKPQHLSSLLSSISFSLL